jgi:hypothetical protein
MCNRHGSWGEQDIMLLLFTPCASKIQEDDVDGIDRLAGVGHRSKDHILHYYEQILLGHQNQVDSEAKSEFKSNASIPVSNAVGIASLNVITTRHYN